MGRHTCIVGKVIRGIEVVAFSHKDNRRSYYYFCRCHCGKGFVAEGTRLSTGRTTGCGCYGKSLQHGRVCTPEYSVWAAMKRRCFNPKTLYYSEYGGRGITVCERWMDFKNFFADMGARPSEKHSIERIDNNGNYEPNNCRWADRHTQARNRRSVIMLTHQGVTKCLKDWAAHLGMLDSTLRERLKSGWPVEKALSIPLRPNKRRIKAR